MSIKYTGTTTCANSKNGKKTFQNAFEAAERSASQYALTMTMAAILKRKELKKAE